MAYDEETIAVYDSQADEYLKVTDEAASDPTLIRFMESLPENAHVLDLGCGPGHCAAVMQKAGFRVTATDASIAMVNLAREVEGIEVYQSTFDELSNTEDFDAIWANFSLLHATKEKFPFHLRQIFQSLRDGGRFHIAMKTGSSEYRDKIGRLYAYYTAEELKDSLAKTGFGVDYEIFGETRGLAGNVSPWVALGAQKP